MPAAASPSPADPRRWRRAFLVGLACSTLAAQIVILTAADVQSGRILDTAGHAWGFHTIFGPDFGSGLNHQGWAVITDPNQLGDGYALYGRLLSWHLAVDTLFICCYTAVLLVLVRRLARSPRWGTGMVGLVLALGLVDLAENLAALTFWARFPAAITVVFTTLKWVLAALVAVLVVLRLAVTPPRPARPRDGGLRVAVKAVITQRFSYFPVLVIFLLAVPTGAAILEQLPDAQRRWIDEPIGIIHALAAISSTLALAYFLSVIGRYRTRYAVQHPENGEPPADTDALPELWVWLVGPIVTYVGVLTTLALSQGRGLLPVRAMIFALLPPLLVIGGSLTVRAVWRRAPQWSVPDQPYDYTPREQFAVSVAGTLAAASAVVVGGLSLIRAFIPLALLPKSETQASRPLVWVMVGIGLLAVSLPWLLLIRWAPKDDSLPLPELPHWIGRLGGDRLRRQIETRGRLLAEWGGWLLLATCILVFLGLGVLPGFTARLGLTATAILAIGSMAGMLSAFGLLVQDKPTAHVFRAVRLRRTPLITMLVLLLIIVGLTGGGAGVHEVDRGPAPDPGRDPRPTLASAFQSWYAAAQRCELDLGSVRVRPMIMVAAEGGGVRAAYWTVRGLQAVQDATCGAYSTLFSAGASGGSVGLTVARFSSPNGEPAGAAAVQAVKNMADPGILAQAADGTFVRDLLYSANGVPVPRLTSPHPGQWRDRAALIEEGWNGSGRWGGQSFLASAQPLSPATGQLILNSTSVRDTCRVWVSQVALPVTSQADSGGTYSEQLSCDTGPVVAPRTLDLFSSFGPFAANRTPSCLGLVNASTAALLTARFPYVTPSGVVGPCPDTSALPAGNSSSYWPRTQLVDGGYVENSGLATITDLADEWLALAREHNRAALSLDSTPTDLPGPTRAGGEPVLVVPLIVFLNNGDRRVVQPAVKVSPTSEFAVPAETYLRGRSALGNNDALLERARAVVELAGFCPTAEQNRDCQTLQQRFPSRVVVVDRLTQPEVSPPLGWTLSAASITALDHAVAAQLTIRCAGRNGPDGSGGYSDSLTGRQPSCHAGYASLGDLVAYLR